MIMSKLPAFRILSAVALGATCLLGNVATANADAASPNVEISVIHATKCATKSVDPNIKEPPPSAMGFDCMTLVSKKVVPMSVGKVDATSLPNGRTFQLTYSERVGNRYKLATAINASGGGFTKLADVTADANKMFNVGGWSHQGGVIVLTIKVLP